MQPNTGMLVQVLRNMTRRAQRHLAKPENRAHAPEMPSDWASRSKADAIAFFDTSTSQLTLVCDDTWRPQPTLAPFVDFIADDILHHGKSRFSCTYGGTNCLTT